MPGRADSKLKTLYLMDILREKTDEDHPMSAADICQELDDRGVAAERKSIYANLEVLRQYNLDVVKTSTPKKGFFLGDREFEPVELRLITDAIQSASFISQANSRKLISKFEKNLSIYQRENFRKQVYIDKRNKTDNDAIYYRINELAEAIDKKCRAKVTYERRRLEEGSAVRNETRIMTVSPYAMVWLNDHYYLICNNAKYDNLMHLRIERIKRVDVLEQEPVRPVSEVSEYKGSFDTADYSAKIFEGFSGTVEVVELRCANELYDTIADLFGSKVAIIGADEDTFTVRVQVATSEGFIGWVLKFGTKMQVVWPSHIRDAVRETAEAVAKQYQI
ncbi:MAG: WYL domain-containing protein [Clostridia bacterium]|nr:WYL domain-containing protein [Clostridia bacterium]MBR5753910.1 WYL domain-containing protein [Clostridia bacterium]